MCTGVMDSYQENLLFMQEFGVDIASRNCSSTSQKIRAALQKDNLFKINSLSILVIVVQDGESIPALLQGDS